MKKLLFSLLGCVAFVLPTHAQMDELTDANLQNSPLIDVAITEINNAIAVNLKQVFAENIERRPFTSQYVDIDYASKNENLAQNTKQEELINTPNITE